MFLFELYHQQSKHLFTGIKSFLPKEKWPDSWKVMHIKTYPRFSSIKLPAPAPIKMSLSTSLLNRVSRREFNRKITIQKLSSLLYYSIGEKKRTTADTPRRMYQSAGARYPLEFYVLIFKKVETLEPGIYHYDVTNHALTNIKKIEFSKSLHKKISLEEFTVNASFAIIFSGFFSRTSEKYGERAYRFVLLEAGGVMQNFALCAEALNIGAVSIGGAVDDTSEEIIGIDGNNETAVHTMYFG